MHLTFMVCIVAMFGSESAEIVRQEGGPECPRFDYEYKVIQRLVRLEDKCEFFERQRGDMENKFTELEIIVEDQRKEIESLKTKQDRTHSPGDQRTIMAKVQQPATLALNPGQRLIFNRVISNTGNAYNTALGQFEAPVNGTYFFSVTLCMKDHAHVTFAIMKENDIIEEAFAGNEEWYICGSGTAVTYLSVKEKVWVKVLKDHGSGLGGTPYGTSSFTAVLINTYKQM